MVYPGIPDRSPVVPAAITLGELQVAGPDALFFTYSKLSGVEGPFKYTSIERPLLHFKHAVTGKEERPHHLTDMGLIPSNTGRPWNDVWAVVRPQDVYKLPRARNEGRWAYVWLRLRSWWQYTV